MPSFQSPKTPQTSSSSSGDRKRKRTTSITPTRPRPTQISYMEAMYSFPSRTIETPRKTIKPLNPHIGAKKLVVKSIKPQAQWDSKAYFDRIWKQLDTALDDIFKSKDISKEELYRGVENVCRQGSASTLYTNFEQRCRNHVNDIRQALQGGSLQAVLDAWIQWKGQMSTIHSIFFFMDRSYLLSSSKPTIAELTPKLFREIVLDDELRQKTIQDACDLITEDRLQHSLPTLFTDAVKMFIDLSIYNSSFEPEFLKTSKLFTTSWSDSQAGLLTVPEYVKAADNVITEEMNRVDLESNTRRELLALLEEDLIVSKLDYLTSASPLAALLDANDIDKLTLLYNLLARKKLGGRLRISFQSWVNEAGTAIVFAENSDNMVVQLLSLQRQLDNIWKNAFQKDESIGHGLRESFEIFMNKTKKGDATWGTDNTKVGEMIAKYVDILLRGGAKAIPDNRRASIVEEEEDDIDEDAEISAQLDQVLDLFRFVHGKAVFEAFYKKDLARRLLMARSASADAERSMLIRLKTECGSGFTQNLEQMFKDIELAREEMQSYKQRFEERLGFEKGRDLDLSVNILSAAAWPTYPDIPVIIPADIKRAIDGFELHYKHKHNGRKLDWKHALAHCQMRAIYPKGSKELVVSSFQAIVLLLFNGLKEGETLTYTHILSETGLPEAEVKRTLQSLACAKLQPLTKHPRGREINDTDTFSINNNFSHPKYRMKINQVQLKETKQENKETHMRVAEDRNFECQAAIVRIMKSRKTIGHSELVSEVIKATMSRGVLAVADIKKNIDRLIEKDYMEREDNGGYSYVA